MTQSFEVPGRMPGLNEIISAAKSHQMVYAKEKRRLTDMVCLLAIAAELKPVSAPVEIRCWWYEPNARRDPSNVRAGVKFIEDGLVMAKILPDDSRKWIKALSDRFPPPSKNPRILVEIIEDPEQ